jgi:CubicO group peptidase (beta-lactamase class C family)
MIHKVFLSVCLIAISLTPVRAQSPYTAELAEIDTYLAASLKAFDAPGCAIAIVKNDSVIFMKGYGVRTLGKPASVTPQTIFAIASNTKAFCATTLGMLADAKKLSLDDKVQTHLPGFKLYDDYASREMTLRDLLAHRSGLATFGADLLWYETTTTTPDVLRRLRYLKPTSSFRSQFGYQNLMFLTAGEVVATIEGKPWSAVVKEKIFTPLGMNRTTTSISEFRDGDDIASPHNDNGGNLHPIPYSNADGIGSAGNINSSAEDMAKWIRLHLGRGTVDGKEFFSRRVAQQLWQLHTPIPLGERAERNIPSRHFYGYGLGFFLWDYLGKKVVEHAGGLDGMISQVAMLPEEKLGVVILTNSESALASAMMYKVIDVFLAAPRRDWTKEILDSKRRNDRFTDSIRTVRLNARIKNTKPSLALSGYAGTFGSEFYGDTQVALENGKLVLRLLPAPKFVADLEHWHYDTFRVIWRKSVSYSFPLGFATFTLDADGKPLDLKLDIPNNDFNFDELELKRK